MLTVQTLSIIEGMTTNKFIKITNVDNEVLTFNQI
jgi:hypothetical protein